MRQSADQLRELLRRMEGRGYGAYRELRGRSFALADAATLHVDYVQGDPYAAPSQLRLCVAARAAAWPADLSRGRARRTAFCDYLARRVRRAIQTQARGRRGSGRSGEIYVDAGGQAMVERNAAGVSADEVHVRLEAGLPAAGRRVLAREAEELLLREMPRLSRALFADEAAVAEARRFADAAENHAALQAQLEARGLAAFAADDALLPRASGVSELPLSGAVPFAAPAELRVALQVPRPVNGAHEITGMGIPRGVTLIIGGGYHGKSTLLRALSRAVFPHIPGDGRELVATHPAAVPLRAEEGRRVCGCDLRAFIREVPTPNGVARGTAEFGSEAASGSTSQAANTVEALEAGARVLLIDEDNAATNFMTRDARMQTLVAPRHEPIIPYAARVRGLHEKLGVSSVIVMGSSGDYFEAADTVIEMRGYAPRCVTAAAKAVAAQIPRQACGAAAAENAAPLAPLRAPPRRMPLRESIRPERGRREIRVAARDTDRIEFGAATIDLRAVEPLLCASQMRAIGYALAAAREWMEPGAGVSQILDALEARLDARGLNWLDPRANLARPRRFEIAAALNRLRTLQLQPQSKAPPA